MAPELSFSSLTKNGAPLLKVACTNSGPFPEAEACLKALATVTSSVAGDLHIRWDVHTKSATVRWSDVEQSVVLDALQAAAEVLKGPQGALLAIPPPPPTRAALAAPAAPAAAAAAADTTGPSPSYCSLSMSGSLAGRLLRDEQVLGRLAQYGCRLQMQGRSSEEEPTAILLFRADTPEGLAQSRALVEAWSDEASGKCTHVALFVHLLLRAPREIPSTRSSFLATALPSLLTDVQSRHRVLVKYEEGNDMLTVHGGGQESIERAVAELQLCYWHYALTLLAPTAAVDAQPAPVTGRGVAQGLDGPQHALGAVGGGLLQLYPLQHRGVPWSMLHHIAKTAPQACTGSAWFSVYHTGKWRVPEAVTAAARGVACGRGAGSAQKRLPKGQRQRGPDAHRPQFMLALAGQHEDLVHALQAHVESHIAQYGSVQRQREVEKMRAAREAQAAIVLQEAARQARGGRGVLNQARLAALSARLEKQKAEAAARAAAEAAERRRQAVAAVAAVLGPSLHAAPPPHAPPAPARVVTPLIAIAADAARASAQRLAREEVQAAARLRAVVEGRAGRPPVPMRRPVAARGGRGRGRGRGRGGAAAPPPIPQVVVHAAAAGEQQAAALAVHDVVQPVPAGGIPRGRGGGGGRGRGAGRGQGRGR